MTPANAPLPDDIPIFPLSRALLLPRGILPLNIFEPRYLAMVEYALSTPHRLIGMIQPGLNGNGLCTTGCAGRISRFEETNDGRYLIELFGTCRFTYRSDRVMDGGFRMAAVDWSAFTADRTTETAPDFDREKFGKIARLYLRQHDMYCDDWQMLDDLPAERMVTMLSMICPLTAPQTQALLECPHTAARAEMLQGFFCAALDVTCPHQA